MSRVRTSSSATGFDDDVHGFLWNSASTTISIASPRSGGRPKSTGLMRGAGVHAHARLPGEALAGAHQLDIEGHRARLAHQA